jgi:hypothetical protein
MNENFIKKKKKEKISMNEKENKLQNFTQSKIGADRSFL